MHPVDRAIHKVLSEMVDAGRTTVTAGEVLKLLPAGLECPNDPGQPLCAVGVLGAMERAK